MLKMEFGVYLVFLSCIVGQALGTCYFLEKAFNSFLLFDTNGIRFAERSDFQISFKSESNSGLLFYAESKFETNGTTLDYEGVYIYQGKLHYFIFNPSKYGTGSSRGGNFITDFEVSDGTWHTVEFFRNKEAEVPAAFSGDGYKKVNQTGFIIDGRSFVTDGFVNAMDVTGQNLFIGGHPRIRRIDQTGKIGAFNGYVKDFKDLLTDKEMFPEQPGQERESEDCGATSMP